MADNHQQTTADPFMQFWSDMASRLTGGAATQAPASGGPSADAVKTMQRAFLDAMAKYCDEFMRSEQFLGMMKQTLDRSLAFKQQLDQFLAQVQRGMGASAAVDTDDLPALLRGIEQRLVSRIDSVEKKVAAVEASRAAGRRAGLESAQRPSARGGARAKRRPR